MSSKKLYFIYNPHAGLGDIYGSVPDIVTYFMNKGFQVDAYATTHENDGYKKIKELGSGYDYVVCAGGDGTLNEATHALLETDEACRPILGYIPAGTTNDFAASTGIPTSLEGALENIISGVPSPMDIGQLNDRYFNYVAAFGTLSDVSYDTSQALKNIFGHAAYVLEGIKRLGSIKSYRCTISHNGEEITDDFLLGVITNSASIGGFKLPVDSFNEQTNFKMILLRYSSRLLDYQDIVATLLGRAEPGPQFIISPADQLTITSYNGISWSLDGEYGGRYSENNFKIHKDKIKILLPRK